MNFMKKVVGVLDNPVVGVIFAVLAGVSAFSAEMGKREKDKQLETLWEAYQKSKEQ